MKKIVVNMLVVAVLGFGLALSTPSVDLAGKLSDVPRPMATFELM